MSTAADTTTEGTSPSSTGNPVGRILAVSAYVDLIVSPHPTITPGPDARG